MPIKQGFSFFIMEVLETLLPAENSLQLQSTTAQTNPCLRRYRTLPYSWFVDFNTASLDCCVAVEQADIGDTPRPSSSSDYAIASLGTTDQ